jgi:hypothetical protein
VSASEAPVGQNCERSIVPLTSSRPCAIAHPFVLGVHVDSGADKGWPSHPATRELVHVDADCVRDRRNSCASLGPSS